MRALFLSFSRVRARVGKKYAAEKSCESGERLIITVRTRADLPRALARPPCLVTSRYEIFISLGYISFPGHVFVNIVVSGLFATYKLGTARMLHLL